METKVTKKRVMSPMETMVVEISRKFSILPVDTGVFKILMVAMRSKEILENLMPDIRKKHIIDDNLLEEVKKLEGTVHTAELPSVISPSSSGTVKHTIQVMTDVESVHFKDGHPTEPWILMSQRDKYVFMYNFEKKIIERWWKVKKVGPVKFIDRKNWIVTGSESGYIRVFGFDTAKQIRSLKADKGIAIVSLVIHPTHPLLLSVDEDGTIKLWNWEKDWTCTQTFYDSACPSKIVFKTTFATSQNSASVQVWSVDDPDHPAKLLYEEQSNRSCDIHSPVDYLSNDSDRRCMNTATTTKKRAYIWDLQTMSKVHTLSYFTGYEIIAAACHPTLPLIVILTKDFHTTAFSFWNSTNYSLVKFIPSGPCTWFETFQFVGTRRLVFTRAYVLQGKDDIGVLEIDMERLAYQQ